MTGLDPDQLVECTIRPVLHGLGLWSVEAEEIDLGTALTESGGLRWIRQRPTGPARGLWQFECATARDVLGRYLNRRDDLSRKVRAVVFPMTGARAFRNLDDAALGFALANNLALGAALCRLIYLWVPAPLPTTPEGQAAYYVQHFNKGGAATPEKYVAAWRRYQAARR